MKLERQRPNTTIRFVDQPSGEVLLRVASDAQCGPLLGFRLYDTFGTLVAESNDVERFPEGLTVRSPLGELLLDAPASRGGLIQYRLYNRDGVLLTCSDGTRTHIYRFLRMESETLRPQPRHKQVNT